MRSPFGAWTTTPSPRCARTAAISSRELASADAELSTVWLTLVPPPRPRERVQGTPGRRRGLGGGLRRDVEHEDRVAVRQRLVVGREGVRQRQRVNDLALSLRDRRRES